MRGSEPDRHLQINPSPAQLSLHKPIGVDPGTTQIGVGQTGVVQAGAGQVSIPQVGFAQVRVGEVGLTQPQPGEVRLPQIRAGKLRAFAVSSAKRASALPEVPSMQEAGIGDFDISQWQGVLAPAGTPREIVNRLNFEILKALNAPEVQERLVTQGGNEIVVGTPEDLASLIKSDLQKYAKLVRDAKIPAQ